MFLGETRAYEVNIMSAAYRTRQYSCWPPLTLSVCGSKRIPGEMPSREPHHVCETSWPSKDIQQKCSVGYRWDLLCKITSQFVNISQTYAHYNIFFISNMDEQCAHDLILMHESIHSSRHLEPQGSIIPLLFTTQHHAYKSIIPPFHIMYCLCGLCHRHG